MEKCTGKAVLLGAYSFPGRHEQKFVKVSHLVANRY